MLMERARSMLSGARLGQEFWTEAVETSCYLVNRSPSSELEDKTPQEIWTGKKPSLSHLRVFGCDAYVHVPKEKLTKLDSKSKKCIFIGYKDGLKGYKLWNPVIRKVVYSRDVVFREIKDVIKHEVQLKEPEKIEFELKKEESNSTVEEESEDEEPQTLGDAIDLEDGKLWKETMVDEMASLHKNEAWDMVELPDGRKPIGSKWVFKKKTNAEGKVEKYKARLIAKGYSQVLGIDFCDIFSPVSKDSQLMKVPIPVGLKLSVEQCPKTQEVEPYASVVGSLMYAMVCTRLDISHVVVVLSRFMSKPGKENWTIVKRVFRYFCGSSDYGLCYQGRPGLDRVLDIRGFVDAEWARDLDQRRSTSGYVFNLFRGAVSWMRKKQFVVALSTIEAKYIATTHAREEAVWL
eukprot:PITA_16903